MPSNVTSSAAFTTGNMKPSAGEQIDALWGQNVADNTGYLYYRRFPACTLGGIGLNFSISTAGTHFATAWFQKFPEYNNLVGTWVGTTNDGGQLVARFDGTVFVNHGGAIGGSLYQNGTSLSIAHLTTGNWYPITLAAGHSSSGIAEFRGLTLMHSP